MALVLLGMEAIGGLGSWISENPYGTMFGTGLAAFGIGYYLGYKLVRPPNNNIKYLLFGVGYVRGKSTEEVIYDDIRTGFKDAKASATTAYKNTKAEISASVVIPPLDVINLHLMSNPLPGMHPTDPAAMAQLKEAVAEKGAELLGATKSDTNDGTYVSSTGKPMTQDEVIQVYSDVTSNPYATASDVSVTQHESTTHSQLITGATGNGIQSKDLTQADKAWLSAHTTLVESVYGAGAGDKVTHKDIQQIYFAKGAGGADKWSASALRADANFQDRKETLQVSTADWVQKTNAKDRTAYDTKEENLAQKFLTKKLPGTT